MRLRVLIAAQLVWVSLAGALCRGLLPEAIADGAEWVVYPTFQFALFGFPVLVLLTVRREHWPEWRFGLVGLIQTALTFATLLAVLPAVQ